MMTFQTFFANKFIRFLAFMGCWAILANLYVFLNPPKYLTPLEYFNVCILENGNPKAFLIKELPPNPQFCQQPLEHVEGLNPWFYFHLKSVDEEWELTQYNDSMGDPWVYRYRIENNQAIPLWYHYGGGFVLHFTAWLYALFATMVIYAIINRILCHKNKKPNHIK